MAQSEHIHAGYQISKEHEGLNMKSLTYFPTNAEISEDLAIASKRANSLIHFAGMGHLDPCEDEIVDSDFAESALNTSSSRVEASDGKYLSV